MRKIDEKTVNAIRVLSADAIQKAKSGHPGMPLGAAPIGFSLYAYHLNFNPEKPSLYCRDRFILSAGHGSMLLYSLNHLFGYDIKMSDIKNFRQLMAERHLAGIFNKENYEIIDNYTYALLGDGCMMEGVSNEAFSLAGTLGLNKLIILYDSNNITIEGKCDLAFCEDTVKKMEAYGFYTQIVEDGNDIDKINEAIKNAKNQKEKPSFIKINTKIGYGCPKKEGSASSHGEPLGEDNVCDLRKTLNWQYNEPFFIPDDVYENCASFLDEKIKLTDKKEKIREEYFEKFPEMKTLYEEYFNFDFEKIINDESIWTYDDKDKATRSSSGEILNKLKEKMKNLFGGSADLAPSNKTELKGLGDFSKDNYKGKNIHFGVREMAMAGIANGIVLYGGLKAFVSTFFVFSDYLKPMARLSALMKLPVIYVFTHDSIGVGEDGPTHEPVEHLAMFRSMPDFVTFRPADTKETIAGWKYALTSKDKPVALVLSRQNLPQLKNTGDNALMGAYIVEKESKKEPDLIMVATGSELNLAIKAREELLKENIDARVVSMPSMELFEMQSEEYKESVLPSSNKKRLIIEALSKFGWGRYMGFEGKSITMDTFGASAPGSVLFEKYGFTVQNVVKTAKELL